jgi:hypothetical protein
MIELNFPNAVTSEEDFYNRRREWNEISRAFRSQDQSPVVILGERRIGKTSMQTVAARRLEADDALQIELLFLPFGSSLDSTAHFALELLQALSSRAGCDVPEGGLVRAGERLELGSPGEYVRALRRVLSGSAGRECLICVDEFDALLRKIEKSDRENNERDAERLNGLVTYLVEQTQRESLPIRLFFSMTATPETVSDSSGSSFISASTLVQLKPFARADMEEMVQRLLSPSVQVLPAAQERLYALSGGHPYVTKLLLYNLLEPFHFEPEGLVVDEAAVDGALAAAVDDAKPREAFGNLYRIWLSNRERQLLLLLAARQLKGRAVVSRQELKVLGLESITAAKRLDDRGYLAAVEEAGGEPESYQLRIGFLGHWLRHWERYELEADKRLREAERRLRRLQNPWDGVEPAVVVTEKELHELGLRS